MKATAPEKLYISDSELNDAEHCIIWFKSQQNDDDIEYTRTDAFIEKTYNWLKNYAFVDDNLNVNLPTLLHDFLKDSRNF